MPNSCRDTRAVFMYKQTQYSDSSTRDKEPMSGGEGMGGEIATTVPPERLASWGIIKVYLFLYFLFKGGGGKKCFCS